jgi:hypothetical protein
VSGNGKAKQHTLQTDCSNSLQAIVAIEFRQIKLQDKDGSSCRIQTGQARQETDGSSCMIQTGQAAGYRRVKLQDPDESSCRIQTGQATGYKQAKHQDTDRPSSRK